jgi:hypothetical protein
MLDTFGRDNKVDAEGNPAGGFILGEGIKIVWQDGPLNPGCDLGYGIEACKRSHNGVPNGAFVETVVAACIQRMEFYQLVNGGKFACRENTMTLLCLREALSWLERRAFDRKLRGVEGTHTP